MSPILAEFFGTMLLILLGTGVVANVVLKDTKGIAVDGSLSPRAGHLPSLSVW